MNDSLDEARTAVTRIASRIDLPDEYLPTFGQSEDFARPHVEVKPPHFFLVVVERGEEIERRSTLDLDELLYWIFEGATFNLATDYELDHRVEAEDFRKLLFARQLELLQILNPRWAIRYRSELGDLLTEVGLGK